MGRGDNRYFGIDKMDVDRIRKTVYGMRKQASLSTALGAATTAVVGGVAPLLDLLGTAFQKASVYTVAAAALGGTGIGWGLSKLTAHDDKDIDLARKMYTSERLKADLGYLSSRLREEQDARARLEGTAAPRSARLLG